MTRGSVAYLNCFFQPSRSSSNRTLRTTFTWYLLQKEFLRVPPSITFLAFPLGVTSKADNLIIGRSADKLAAQRLAAICAGVAPLVVALALKCNVYQIGLLGMQFTQFSGKYKKRRFWELLQQSHRFWQTWQVTRLVFVSPVLTIPLLQRTHCAALYFV